MHTGHNQAGAVMGGVGRLIPPPHWQAQSDGQHNFVDHSPTLSGGPSQRAQVVFSIVRCEPPLQRFLNGGFGAACALCYLWRVVPQGLVAHRRAHAVEFRITSEATCCG